MTSNYYLTDFLRKIWENTLLRATEAAEWPSSNPRRRKLSPYTIVPTWKKTSVMVCIGDGSTVGTTTESNLGISFSVVQRTGYDREKSCWFVTLMGN